MSALPDNHQVEVSGAQLEFQIVDYQNEISSLETRIQFLEGENARLQEALRFFVEICCCEE